MKLPEKSAADHRQPKWPLMGYAPGGYIGRCSACDGRFFGMDKRAFHCLPCAVDLANERAKEVVEALQFERSRNETLRSAIRIVQEPTAADLRALATKEEGDE